MPMLGAMSWTWMLGLYFVRSLKDKDSLTEASIGVRMFIFRLSFCSTISCKSCSVPPFSCRWNALTVEYIICISFLALFIISDSFLTASM
jgi:hypothetical protein